MAAWRLKKNCSGEFNAAHHSGPRPVSDIRYLVVHCTQQAVEDPAKPLSARGVAKYFAGEDSGGSTQLVVSDLDCYRTLPDWLVPWGAPPLNETGVHVEICGRAEWSKARWLLHALAIRRAAYKSALRCHKYDVPLVLIRDPAVLREKGTHPKKGGGGVTDHATVARAFHESDHTDPGPNFPWGLYMALLRRYVGQLKG